MKIYLYIILMELAKAVSDSYLAWLADLEQESIQKATR